MHDSPPPQRRPPFRGAPAPKKVDLKEELAKALGSEDLARKRKFVEGLAAETGAEMENVAAALLFLLEAQRRENQSRPARRPFSQNRDGGGNRYERSDGRSGPPSRRDSSPRGAGRRSGGAMTKYRIEVGRVHGLVGPGQIVGALANESELSGADIGGIDIQTHFSTVDLPNDMTDEVLRGLRQVRIAGQALQLSKWERGGDARLREKPKSFQRKRGGGGKPSWKKSRTRVAPPSSDSSNHG